MPMTESLPSEGSTAWYAWATEIHGDVDGIRNVARIPAKAQLVTDAGQWWDGSLNGLTAANSPSTVANAMDLFPIVFPADFAVDQIAVQVHALVAASELKLIVYASTADGWPGALIHETTALDSSSNGNKAVAWSYTFLANVVYWVGVRASTSGVGLRGIPLGGTPSFGLPAADGVTYFTRVTQTLTFATAAPDPWGFALSQRVANVGAHSVRFRAA